ncbi:endonuclease/exonuclease/phosphatase family protein, partial [Streptomyces asiaticus]
MPLADLPGSTTGPDAAVVRVLSYNIRSMRDDREALARVIRACAPDVVCVQEAPRFFRWRKAAAWLARETG